MEVPVERLKGSLLLDLNLACVMDAEDNPQVIVLDS